MNDKYSPERPQFDEGARAEPMATRVNQLSQSAGCEVEREPKAAALMSQITRMDHIVERLCHLRDRVQNGNIPMGSSPSKPDSMAPTVSAVLTEGPNMLQTTFNQMNDILDQVESELF